MINNVTIVGNITRDIEIKTTNSNKKMANFTVAINNGKSKAGEPLPADFISCQAWEFTAEFLERYARKGNKVAVSGRLKTRTWEAQDGKHSITYVLAENIELMNARETGYVQDTLVGNGLGVTGQHEEAFKYADIKEDDLPFY